MTGRWHCSAAAAALTLVMLGGSGALGASTSRTTAPKAQYPAWTCASKGSNDIGPIDVKFRNTTGWSLTLTSPKPADCAPWMGSQTPGQVNTAGYIETKTFPLLYDELADLPTTPGSDAGTWRTPLGITVHVGDVAFKPGLALLRVTNAKGLYTTRAIVIRTPKGDVCTGAEGFKVGRVTVTVSLTCSDPGTATWPYDAPAVVTISK